MEVQSSKCVIPANFLKHSHWNSMLSSLVLFAFKAAIFCDYFFHLELHVDEEQASMVLGSKPRSVQFVYNSVHGGNHRRSFERAPPCDMFQRPSLVVEVGQPLVLKLHLAFLHVVLFFGKNQPAKDDPPLHQP